MSSDLLEMQKAIANSETQHLDTQKQIAQIMNALHQLNENILQISHPPQPSPLVDTTPKNPPPSAPTKRGPPPALPNEFDGERSKGPAFLRSCQTYILLSPELFSEDQTKIVWALSYMKSGRAAKWAARVFKWEEDNGGDAKFLDWDDFKSEFRKEFCPAHSDVTAINKLESTTYYQRNRSVDDYLDEFLDLIAESGYTDPKTLVVKFRRGLDPQIQNAVATMSSGRPSDIAPTAWYEAARNVDQNRASNEAFRSTLRAPTPFPNHLRPPAHSSPRPPPLTQAHIRPTPDNPVPMDVDRLRKKLTTTLQCYRCGLPGHTVPNCPRRYDVRVWTNEELEEELATRFAKMDSVAPEDCPSVTEEALPVSDFPQDNE
jgi:hypothetical protein